MAFELIQPLRVAATSIAVIGAGAAVALQGQLALAGACDRSTSNSFKACYVDAGSSYQYAVAMCANIKDLTTKQNCQTRAADDQTSAQKLCDRQQAARKDVCAALGQSPYDPTIRPKDFSAKITNPLMPLTSGDVRVYKNGQATVTVMVTDQTIQLLGVTCLIVRDMNVVNGAIEEDTFDYYAQDRAGNVWYFGEDTIAYNKGIASTEGSWRAGVNGAKPGIIMFADPQLGQTYRQEFMLGNAEDLAKTVAFNQHVKVPYGAFTNAFETLEFTPLEPGAKENKFYVRNVGEVLSIDLDTGEHEELVSFTHR